MTAIKEEHVDWDEDIAVDDEEVYESLMLHGRKALVCFLYGASKKTERS
jgi:hypothetical protein